ncbi:RepB family protein [Aeromonas tecta]|uniref:RepB family protein n=1 Tax=Aeromonas tecta TaxID=324617 RepID=UPI00067FEA9A|nr:RepB family protein [Aeromonas tecta]
MSQEKTPTEALDNAERQRQHVKRKQESHSRLQCWISNRHAERLHELGLQLEDSQASLIEQAIDLLYQHELVPQYVEERSDEHSEEKSQTDIVD